jgi:ABC-type phosphate transport system substrate-binding protein
MRKTTKVYAVAALAGGCILATAARADAANCNSYPHAVYIAGSSASQPILQALAYQLKQAGSQISIIYENPSSCQGLKDLLQTSPLLYETKGASYIDGTANPGTLVTCDPTNPVNGVATTMGSSVDIGVSDVFPQTCVDYSGIPALTATQKDWWGPVQAMVMAVQAGQTMYPSISAEAAYLVFGWAGQMHTVAPWTDPQAMYIRTPTSGTESMIAKAIGLPPTKWLVQSPFDGGSAQFLGGSGAVVTALKGSTNAMGAIGILSTEYVDQNRSTLHALAFQAKDPNGGDQMCGYLPDSDAQHFDKLNVRQGRYGIWGPLHFVTNVDSTGKAQPNANSGTMAADVQTVLQWLTFNSSLTAAQTLSMIQASGSAYTVPPCAMEVSRMQDGGGVASQMPASGMCGCYYEALAAGNNNPAALGMPTSSYCHACTSNTDCSGQGIYKTCNYGFCEVQ